MCVANATADRCASMQWVTVHVYAVVCVYEKSVVTVSGSLITLSTYWFDMQADTRIQLEFMWK